MAKPNRPVKPYDTDKKRLEHLEYLMYRICETLKINYEVD